MFKYIKPYKIFESNRNKLMDFSFLYNPNSNTGFFNIVLYNGDTLEMMFKKTEDEENKKESHFKLFPPTINILDFEQLTQKLIELLNQNKMGYQFSLKNIVNRRYGLSSYASIECDKTITPHQLEKMVSEVKPKTKGTEL
jgi:hypothetical protein